ncbi:diguanylate cyclase [Candidatus Uhrbacteria bacterium]|nr:diguanylate cyclase [Candidatus Uhrbacteria bacterium]
MDTLPTTLLEAHARIRELEDRILAEEKEVERLNRDLERKDAEIQRRRRDGLTGLFRRDELWPHLAALIRRFMDTPVAGKLMRGLPIENLTPAEIASMNTTLIWGDLSYLALANAYGHEVGDQVLERFGATLQSFLDTERLATGYDEHGENVLLLRHFGVRHGGDEFVVILADTHMEEAATLMAEMALRYKKERISRLIFPLRVDYGHCHIWEAFEAYQYWTRLRGVPRTFRDRVTLIRRIMTTIADTRSKKSKMIARIGLVARILVLQESRFTELLPYITKGMHFPRQSLDDLVAAARVSQTETGKVLDILALDEDVRRAVNTVFEQTQEQMRHELATLSPHNGEDLALSRLAHLATQGEMHRFLDGEVGIQTL